MEGYCFVDTVEAYNRLSPLFKEKLEGLKAVHSAVEQANFAIFKRVMSRDIQLKMCIQLLELLLWARKFCMSITVSLEELRVKRRGIFLLVKLLLDHIWKVMTFKLELTGNQTRWLYLITELLVTLPFLILILLIQD